MTARPRRSAVVTALVALSAFGPYVVGGFRTEQIAVYATFAVLVIGIRWTKVRPNRHGIVVMALLLLQLAIAAIGAADPSQNTTPFQFGNPLAGMDNLALPIAVVASVWMLLAPAADRHRLIRVVCWVTVWAMVANAGMAVWATAGGGPDLALFQGQLGLKSIAYRAEQMGRFSGIFNQPAEAGLMYSMSLLSALYLYRERALLLAVTATTLCIGGVLSVSKVFLLLGLPIGMWQVLRSAAGRERRVAALVAAVLAVWATARSALAPEWTGGNFLLRLMPGNDQGVVELYTAGRLGSNSTLAVVADPVMASSPLWGFGAGGLQAAYDNAWVQALTMGGIFGAAVLTVTMAVLVHAWWHARTPMSRPECRLAGGLVVLVIGAAVGAPSLTINRCATIVWLLLTLLLLSHDTTERSDNSATHA